MIDVTSVRIWIGVTVAWPLLCLLLMDRWFFLSPLGLLVSLGLPVAGWALWWKFYRLEDEKPEIDAGKLIDKSAETLDKLKKRIQRQ
jgi:hypothetical protein